jgi:hypothetical protein
MLLPIIRWVIHNRLGPELPINPRTVVRAGPVGKRLEAALRQSADCDLLVVHRDAVHGDHQHEARIAEITDAVAVLAAGSTRLPQHVCVVPVRMSEAWLLFDETAIRRAAGRPNGKVQLNLPRRGFDSIADPKQVLNDALDRASERTGRKLEAFKRDRRPSWVADWIGDFSPLQRLPAFRHFEGEIDRFAKTWEAERSDPN